MTVKIIEDFVGKVVAIYKTGVATEHSYRPALESLFSSFGVTALNEPKRVACGAPDFIIQSDGIVIGHVEAKDLDVCLRGMKGTNKKQQIRYCKALPNLIYTNCLDWDFYQSGELVLSVTIADYIMGIQPRPDQYKSLENLLRNFISQCPQTITSPRVLAEMMAGKAALIKDVLHKALETDDNLQTELTGQFHAFREYLIRDIVPSEFADIYAETIAYGMFAARLHDTSLENFTRQRALALLPKSNPFLRSLFGYIAGVDLDERIAWIIDDLAAVFHASNVKKVMEGFGRLTGQNDPFLHFYESFLAAYNPAKRKARGVWYTPEPVVNFIVRAVDRVLQTEFFLPDGLADTSKISIDWATSKKGNRSKPATTRKEVHRVQILDPATGTGTFLAEVFKQIAPKVKDVAESMWSPYIERNLIPRLHGFELLMASYAMCHMKLEMILTELGYKPSSTPPRLSVYLTNSLEEGEPAYQTLQFAQWLSNEVKQANTIKHDMPIMCIIGNPPYSGESANRGAWIAGLIDAYKNEPGSKEKLKERNTKWINDDYVKFIRLSEHLIERNGDGVLGFITNHGYLDNPTFRGMRWHLLNTFDKLWVLDLHGNAKKKEVTPDGKPDKNIFDIQQGVAILIAVKRKQNDRPSKPLAEVWHSDIWGDRSTKYEALSSLCLNDSTWKKLDLRHPLYCLTQRNYTLEDNYRLGFGVQELMPIKSVGIVTARDSLAIDMDREALWSRVQEFAELEPEVARQKYNLGKDVRDWAVRWAQKDAKASLSGENIVPIAYRPFDIRWTFYTGKSRGFMCYPRHEVMRHMVGRDNVALCTTAQTKDGVGGIIVQSAAGHKAFGAYDINTLFPLYLYPDDLNSDQPRRVNFDPGLFAKLQSLAAHPEYGQPNEIQVFDYIYGVLHCPVYRKLYREFLRRDFPRIPWPAFPSEFWDVSTKGNHLRKLHLMDPEVIGSTPYPIKGEGDIVVETPEFREGKIWINRTQYFDGIPETSWCFYIGGYQPAQKWLKDRKGRTLSYEDVKHYQRILKILWETQQTMEQITLTLPDESDEHECFQPPKEVEKYEELVT